MNVHMVVKMHIHALHGTYGTGYSSIVNLYTYVGTGYLHKTLTRQNSWKADSN